MNERPPLEQVLVATDFSGAAMRAIQRAAGLPFGPGATLTVLHVLRSGCGAADRADATRGLAEAASVAAGVVTATGRTGVEVVTHMAEGTPFEEIVRAARDAASELVVVGRHGERTFRELLLGSTAERVIRTGETPVLVVTAPPAASYERPLVAVDCSESSRCALELAWRIVGPRTSGLEIVHAYDTISESALRRAEIFGEAARRYRVEAQRRAQTAIDAFLAAGASRPATIVLREGDARGAILDVAVQHDADLLALGTHGRAGPVRVLIGSVAEAVIRAAHCDVLVTRAGTPGRPSAGGTPPATEAERR